MNSRVINNKIYSISKSKFRSSFHLNNKMKKYVLEHGINKIEEHTYDIVSRRLKVLKENDGKQTPMKQVHPVFIAQHATATCCRGCIEKWHHIPKNKELNNKDIDFLVTLIITWIKKECNIK